MIAAAVLTVAAFAAPIRCQAGGFTVSRLATDTAGMQTDAVTLSPSHESISRETGSISYVVQTGDSMGALAERFGVSSALIARENGIDDADLMLVGSTIHIGAGSRARRTDIGELDSMRAWPWPVIQGQTVIFWLQGSQGIEDGRVILGNEAYPIVDQGDVAWAMLPVGPLLPGGDYPIALTGMATDTRLDLPVQEGVFESYDVPADTSTPILSETQKVSNEAALVTDVLAGWEPDGWTPGDRFAPPLDGEFVHTSPYGSRRTYGGGVSVTAHAGEDFSAPPGTPVSAPAGGLVVLAQELFVRGNAIIIDHGHGVFTGYWHLSALAVSAGDRVDRGQLLGEVGSTGLSTGAHLHWELRIDGMAVDPLQWLETDK